MALNDLRNVSNVPVNFFQDTNVQTSKNPTAANEISVYVSQGAKRSWSPGAALASFCLLAAVVSAAIGFFSGVDISSAGDISNLGIGHMLIPTLASLSFAGLFAAGRGFNMLMHSRAGLTPEKVKNAEKMSSESYWS